MNVLAFSSLGKQVDVCVGRLVRKLGQLRRDVKREGAEVANVHALALTQVVVQVGDQGSPDDQHLCLGLQRLLRLLSSNRGEVVLPRVVAVLEDPALLENVLTSQ